MSVKEAVIKAAERRFALNGIEATSMRQVAIDAGQRNESAALYHFGSREGLIRAILNHRVVAIDRRRQQMLDDLERGINGPVCARGIASVIIIPMADEIFSDWSQCYWVRFISQLWSIEKFQHIGIEFEKLSPALLRTHELLRNIPDIDPAILEVRHSLMQRSVMWGLSRVEAMSFHESRELCALHVANLVDMIAAGFDVKPSEDTLEKFRTAAALPSSPVGIVPEHK